MCKIVLRAYNSAKIIFKNQASFSRVMATKVLPRILWITVYIFPVGNLWQLLSCLFEVQCMAIWLCMLVFLKLKTGKNAPPRIPLGA